MTQKQQPVDQQILLLPVTFCQRNILKGTAMTLTVVILDFSTLRDTKPQILTPKGITITPVTFIWEYMYTTQGSAINT